MTATSVREGSIYNPGWEVCEEVRERHLVVLATFSDRSDAEDFLLAALDNEREIQS